MTIWTLIIGFAIAAAILTGLTVATKKHKSIFMSFLQHFTGVWFIFSGVVKAIDPWGTAIKMQQYFGEFETTAKGSFLKGIAAMFPYLAQFALAFSIVMIVLEIVVGVMLILGHRPKLTAWLYLLVMIFFTILTGYTHLTGYVPSGVNFFDFSKWGEYVVSNMKVTDCGCFGDFLKLSPTTSFYKDCALMPVALILLVFSRKWHKIAMAPLVWVSLFGSIAFCWYNAFQNEPVVDFRPFKNGVNIREQKKAEEDAAAKVQILDWVLINDKTGETVTLSNRAYLDEKGYEKYSKDAGWKIKDQIKSTPSVPHTKISEFSLNDKEGMDVAERFLSEPKYMLVAVSWKMKSTVERKTVIVPDSIYKLDTIRKKMGKRDTFDVKKTFDRIAQREEVFKSFRFDEAYRRIFTDKINPLFEAAEKAGLKTAAIVPYAEQKQIDDFRHDAQAAYPFYTADDVLLKTMIRSNPGIFLFKNGQIVKKWHIKNTPDFTTLKRDFLK